MVCLCNVGLELLDKYLSILAQTKQLRSPFRKNMKVHSVLHVLSELELYLYPKPFLIRVPWLTVTRAWERYIESAEWVYRGVEEGIKRLIELELGDEREEKLR